MLYIPLLLSVSFFLSYLFYGRNLKFLFLRGFSIFFLLIILFNLEFEYRVKREPNLCLLLDNSKSMDADWKKEWALSIIDSLGNYGRLNIYLFGDSLRRGKPTWTDRTTIFRCGRIPNCDLILMVSDGFFKNPLSLLNVQTPLYVFFPESVPTLKDINLEDVEIPPSFSPGDSTDISIKIEVVGYDKLKASIHLYEGEKILATSRKKLRSGENLIVFRVPPLKTGKHRLSLRIKPLEGEIDTLNNSIDFIAYSIVPKKRVILISSHPTPLIRLLRDALDEMNELTYDVAVKLDGGYRRLGKRVEKISGNLSGEIFIFVDPEPDMPVTIGDKTPFILFFERGSNYGLKLMKIGGIVRVETKRELIPFPAPYLSEWLPAPYPDFPPLKGVVKIAIPNDIKPYLYVPLKTVKGYYPLVFKVKGNYVVTGIDIWRIGLKLGNVWRRIVHGMVKDIIRSRPIFIVRWGRGILRKDEPLYVEAEAYDGEGNPLSGLLVRAEVGNEVYTLYPEKAGMWRSSPIYMKKGEKLKLSFFKGDSLLYSEEKKIEVIKSTPELFDRGINRDVLSQVAVRSGGKILREPSEIKKIMGGVELYDVKNIRTRSLPFFIVFLLLIIVEWWERKREGLL